MGLKSRKGDAPSVMLLAIALALYMLEMYVFLSFDAQKNKGEDAYVISDSVESIEIHIFSTSVILIREAMNEKEFNGEDIKERIIEVSKRHDFRLENTNFYGRIRNGEFTLYNREGKWVIEAKDIFIKVEKGESRAERVLNLHAEFDDIGRVQKIYK